MGVISGVIIIYMGIEKKLYGWSSILFCYYCFLFIKLYINKKNIQKLKMI